MSTDTLHVTLPPPENDGRDRAAESLDAMLSQRDRHPLQRKTSPRESLFDHSRHHALGNLARVGVILEDHPVAVSPDTDTERCADRLTGGVTVNHRVDGRHERARRDHRRNLQELGPGRYHAADFDQIEVPDASVQQGVVERVQLSASLGRAGREPQPIRSRPGVQHWPPPRVGRPGMSPARSIRVRFHPILSTGPSDGRVLKLGNEKAPPQGGPAWNGPGSTGGQPAPANGAGMTLYWRYSPVLAQTISTSADKR